VSSVTVVTFGTTGSVLELRVTPPTMHGFVLTVLSMLLICKLQLKLHDVDEATQIRFLLVMVILGSYIFY
jgi:hypothetical protein